MKKGIPSNLAGVGLAFFAGIPPLLVCNSFLDSFGLLKRTAGDLLLCLLILMLAFGFLSGKLKIRLCAGHYLLFLFFLVSAVSVVEAPDKYYGLKALLQTAGWLAAAAAGYQILRGPEEAVRFVRATAFFALLVGLAGLFEIVTGSSYFMNLKHWGGRTSSTFGAPTLFSGYVLTVLFLAQGGFVLDGSKKYKLLYGTLWLVMMVNLFKTATLTAWAAFAAANVLFVWGVVRKAGAKQPGEARRKAALFVVLTLLLGVVLWAVLGSDSRKGVFSDRFNADKAESMGFRLQRWNAAVDMFKDNPAVGVGSGMFGVYYPLYLKHDAAGGNGVDTPENLFMSLISETGAIGGVVFTGGLLFSLFIFMKRRPRGSPEVGVHAVMFGCAAAAVLMYAMFHSPLQTDGVWGLFWVCVGGFWAAGVDTGGQRPEAPPAGRLRFAENPAADGPLFCAVAIVMVFSAFFSLSFLMKEYYVYRAVKYYEGGRMDKAEVEIDRALKLTFGKDWSVLNIAGAIAAEKNGDKAYGYYERAARFRSFNADLYYEMFNVIDKEKKAGDALGVLDAIIDIKPNAVNAYMLRATQYERMGLYGEAARDLGVYLNEKKDASWREYYLLYLCMTRSGGRDARKETDVLSQVISRNPDNYLPYYQMGMRYSRKGDRERAREMFERALELNPGSKESAEALKSLHKNIR